MELIDISGVGQIVGQANRIVETFVCYSFTDECIIIIGGTEAILLFALHGNVLIESSVYSIPVMHGISYDDLEADGVTIVVVRTLPLDNLDGTVEVLHGLLWLCVHLDIGQVHVDRCQISNLAMVNLIESFLEILMS